jgi:hypothetical protein
MAMWKGAQHLWKIDLGKLVETLKEKAPSHAKFEERLAGYTHAAMRMLGEARDVDLDWIRVDTRPLALAVHRASLELTAAVAVAMREVDLKALASERARIAELGEIVQREPETLEVRGA